MARGITENDVWLAADGLLLEGLRPTIERVRQKLGRGSPNTVSPMLETWFKHLGGRIKDPKAFSAPAALPDPISQAAQHFWEAALATARQELDEARRQVEAAAAQAIEEAERRASSAVQQAALAESRLTGATAELADQNQALMETKQELAAEHARLTALQAALTAERDRRETDDQRWSAEAAGLRAQLAAALERADAADRRVALELDRERTARSRAERQAEQAQRALDDARQSAAREAHKAGQASQAMQAQLAGLTVELDLARRRAAELREAEGLAKAEARVMSDHLAELKATVGQLTLVVEKVGGNAPTKPPSKSRQPAAKDRP